MYEFNYKHINGKYSANLLFTDTDSLVYEIETDNVPASTQYSGNFR